MARTKNLIGRVEVVKMLGVDEDFLVSLEREEIVVCETEGHYTSSTLERIRVCQSLHKDLGVNFAGLEVALQLLDTIQSERSQFEEVLDWLRKQLDERGTR